MASARLRVLYLTTDSALYGTERVILSLLQTLPRDRFDLHLATLKGPGDLVREAQTLGIPSVNFALTRKTDPAILWRLFRHIRQVRPDILCAYLWHAFLLARTVGVLARVPVIITAQEGIDHWRRWPHNLLDRLTSPAARLILANSQAVKVQLIANTGIPAGKIQVIHNGIDLARFAALRAQPRAPLSRHQAVLE